MDKRNIEEVLFKNFKKHIFEKVSIDLIKNSTDIISEFDIDSVSFMMFLIDLEKSFNITIEVKEVDIEIFKKWSTLVEFLNCKLDLSYESKTKYLKKLGRQNTNYVTK